MDAFQAKSDAHSSLVTTIAWLVWLRAWLVVVVPLLCLVACVGYSVFLAVFITQS